MVIVKREKQTVLAVSVSYIVVDDVSEVVSKRKCYDSKNETSVFVLSSQMHSFIHLYALFDANLPSGKKKR